jgi:hypothetical protein
MFLGKRPKKCSRIVGNCGSFFAEEVMDAGDLILELSVIGTPSRKCD